MEKEYFTIFFYLFIHDNSVKKKTMVILNLFFPKYSIICQLKRIMDNNNHISIYEIIAKKSKIRS